MCVMSSVEALMIFNYLEFCPGNGISQADVAEILKGGSNNLMVASKYFSFWHLYIFAVSFCFLQKEF